MDKIYTNLIKEATQKGFSGPEDFLAFKKSFCGAAKIKQPTNADLREIYNALVKTKKIKCNEILEKAMLARAIRTQSGVAVVAVLTKPYPCPGQCLYCPTEKGMPKSYLSNEPAVMRAIANQFDPYLQTHNRLKVLELNGHATDKIELIVMGGTFSYFPQNYQQWFVAECFRACNNYPRLLSPFFKGGLRGIFTTAQKSLSDSPFYKGRGLENLLLKEQNKNEKARHRIIGLTLETRPDYIDAEEILNFRNLGCTRVELGVQSIFNSVLKINRRGHDIEKTIAATKLLKDAGFKINYHMMPGLPGSSYKKDIRMFKELFSNPNFQPDMLKIYPTVVVKNSALFTVWKKKKYTPLTDKQFEKMILEIKNTSIPPYVRIARLVRDVPTTSVLGGPNISNLRQIIAHRSQCPCIRCREVRADYKIKEKIILDRIDYPASGGQEIFLQYVSPDKKKLFALLRLRIPNPLPFEKGELERDLKDRHKLLPVLSNSALIREVHTYGQLAEIDKIDKKSPQHIGLGKKLMQEAERIAREEFNLKKIVVISGVGVRDYYRKLGYRQKETYMVKSL